MKEENGFPWSDHVCWEGSQGWFVSGTDNVLYSLDRQTGKCHFVKELPNSQKGAFRLNPVCAKKGDFVYCFPCFAESIWVYSLSEGVFTEIPIENKDKKPFRISTFAFVGEKLFVLMNGLCQIALIDLKKNRVEEYYSFPDPDTALGGGLVVNNCFICVAVSGLVYEFDLSQRVFNGYPLTNIEDSLSGICFDGTDFWISGNRKKIYRWNKETDSIQVYDKFPDSFGFYDFSENTDGTVDRNMELSPMGTSTFSSLFATPEKIWMIPYQANEILCLEKRTGEIHTVDVPDERENRESLRDRIMYAKYLFEYIIENRYIGLYSLKQRRIIEIDTQEERVIYPEFEQDEREIIENALINGWILYETKGGLDMYLDALKGLPDGNV